MTNVVNKHVLPVYDEPMVFYPVRTLLENGIDEILVISTPADIGRYIQLLEDEFDASFTYRVQKEPGGIAHAVQLAEDFVDDAFAVVLGDNIVLDDFHEEFNTFEEGGTPAKIFLKQVDEPARYGVAAIEDGVITQIEEKPDVPISEYAIIGAYLYRAEVFDRIETLDPSDRGELEITDVNKQYVEDGTLEYEIVEGEWFDAGTPEGMHQASTYVRDKHGPSDGS
jgi:glucose-1-phosphate thymidylyltransferase